MPLCTLYNKNEHWFALWMGTNNIFFPSKISARSHLIESPPTYNVHYSYKSWEAFSNLSYYTRALPPVPDDCPTPMGVKGEWEETVILTVTGIGLIPRKFDPKLWLFVNKTIFSLLMDISGYFLKLWVQVNYSMEANRRFGMKKWKC